MHDWTLISVEIHWEKALIEIGFRDNEGIKKIIAHGFTKIFVPKQNLWGHSVSVNSILPCIQLPDGKSTLRIEMQSGDVIEIEANEFVMPRF